VFESKSIKRKDKIPFQQQSSHSNYYSKSTTNISSQLSNNNNYTIAPDSPNPYISRKLKGIEVMINVQRIVKDMKKMAEETYMMITEMEGMILMASINNQTVNTTNITQISEDL